MDIVKYLTGQVAAYLEFYEFLKEGALMGVPDYVPAEIVDGKVTVMPNAFGDFGEGLLNVSKLKTGRVTLCRLGSAGADYTMHIMTGTARTPIKWAEAGWAPPAPQLPSLEIVFDGPVEAFVQKVMSQHYIISYGWRRSAHSWASRRCRRIRLVEGRSDAHEAKRIGRRMREQTVRCTLRSLIRNPHSAIRSSSGPRFALENRFRAVGY